jgi:hypothetical protein
MLISFRIHYSFSLTFLFIIVLAWRVSPFLFCTTYTTILDIVMSHESSPFPHLSYIWHVSSFTVISPHLVPRHSYNVTTLSSPCLHQTLNPKPSVFVYSNHKERRKKEDIATTEMKRVPRETLVSRWLKPRLTSGRRVGWNWHLTKSGWRHVHLSIVSPSYHRHRSDELRFLPGLEGTIRTRHWVN